MSLQIWLPFTKDDSNYGILNMNPTSNTGKKVNSDHGGGYEFNNAEKQCIRYEHKPEINNFKSFSISCWAKNNVTEKQDILSLTYDVIIQNTGFFVLHPETGHVISAGSNIGINKLWHNYILTFNYDLQKFYYYLDGILTNELQFNYDNGKYKIVHKNGLIVGADSNDLSQEYYYFNGTITDVRVYNHCLSPLEIKQLSVGLIGHYPLNQFEKSSKNLISNSKSLSYWIGYDEKTSNGMFSVAKFTYTNINDNYIDMNYSGTFNVESNTYYTFSFFAKASSNLKFQSFFYNNNNPDGYAIVSAKNSLGNTNTNSDGEIVTNAITTWKRYWIIWKTGPHVTLPLSLILARFVNTSNSKGDTIWIYAPKLEKGYNENPQWTPGFGDGDWPQIEYDISGLTNNIPLSEDINPLFVSDTARYSGSYNFNEVGQTIGTREHIKPTKNVSISAWVKSSKIDTVTEPNVDVDGINIYVNNSGIIHLVGTFGDLNSSVSCIDTWTHACGTYDGTTVKLYVNGVLKSSKSYSSDLKYVKGAAISSDSKSGITCKVSDFRIFSTALKDDYITDLYNMGAAVSSGTLAAYELNE